MAEAEGLWSRGNDLPKGAWEGQARGPGGQTMGLLSLDVTIRFGLRCVTGHFSKQVERNGDTFLYNNINTATYIVRISTNVLMKLEQTDTILRQIPEIVEL